jgi:hypothetical protein
MIATTMKMIGFAGLIAAGLVAADDFAMGSSAQPAAVVKQSERHPGMTGTPSARIAQAMAVIEPAGLTVAGDKADRVVAMDHEGGCSEETWPRIAPECLLSANATARKAVRTITVERQTSPNTSTLERRSAL